MKSEFEWGDRIDHKKFGLGTVNGAPEGDKVPIKWDDPSRADTNVVGRFLRLVTRPDAKGGAFWNHEYMKLVQAVESARCASDAAMTKAFRPNEGSGADMMDQALAAEKITLDALRAFLVQDEKGEHA